MSTITPDVLFKAYKNEIIDLSKQYGEAVIPTSILFQFFDGEIWVFPDLDAQLITPSELKEDLELLEYLDEPMSLDIDYDYTSVNFGALFEAFTTYAPTVGFEKVNHIKADDSHLIWLGHLENEISIACGEDLEKYCLDHITQALNQLHLNFFDKINVMKSGELIPFEEKIKCLIPYWGEHGLDCYYINPPKNTDDLNDGILLGSYFSIYETEYLEEWIKKEEKEEYPLYNRFVEINFILYRVCIKLQGRFNDHPLFHKNFSCYPCSHGLEEEFNPVFYNLAKETIDLPIEEYLTKCKENFENKS
ncbi:hypothetical protein [Aquimarina brevivitae]|uniref:Uncharacterized protein n=1 Tax=Aquimarina brevivitae TaxID=323412 RepID=A0A4Q7PH15_9FLAO|nr:hypothetical protein [Aquimarina brevivitae]RZS99841.1 hypothetical protein EV197_1069 [Aquimarina brevivitae]